MTNISEVLQMALKHHQEEQLQKAESIYHQILQKSPNQPHMDELITSTPEEYKTRVVTLANDYTRRVKLKTS